MSNQVYQYTILCKLWTISNNIGFCYKMQYMNYTESDFSNTEVLCTLLTMLI